MNKEEALAELRPIIDALRAWNNKYNVIDDNGTLFLSTCIIDKPETGKKHFHAFTGKKNDECFSFVAWD